MYLRSSSCVPFGSRELCCVPLSRCPRPRGGGVARAPCAQYVYRDREVPFETERIVLKEAPYPVRPRAARAQENSTKSRAHQPEAPSRPPFRCMMVVRVP